MNLRWLAVAACALVAAPIAVFTVLEIPDFFDSCHSFGAPPSGVLTPTEECPTVTASSETVVQAIVRLVFVQGSVLVAAGLGIWAVLRRNTAVQLAVSALFAALSFIPFNSFAPAFGLVAAAMAWSAHLDAPWQGLAQYVAWVVAILGIGMAGYWVFGGVMGVIGGFVVYALFALVLVASGALMAWAALSGNRSKQSGPVPDA